MKKCKECGSRKLNHEYFGDHEEYVCQDCGLIASRVIIGREMGHWMYSRND